jgi:methylmalonyl-CoA/ethylmalonyl-CoA epimerase
MLGELDHVAIVVGDTEEALRLWRDTLGFPLLFSEVVNQGTVRLTHLDLGSTHLQLVEPLTADHPLKAWLDRNGTGLHHICLRVDNVGSAMSELHEQGVATAPAMHQGTWGKRAIFLDKSSTMDIQVEITGE